MGFIRAIFGFIIAIGLMVFAVANRQSIPLNYSPLHEPLELPLYMLTLGFMATGFILGAILMWMNAAPTRRIKRQQRKTIKTLEKEIAALESQNEKTFQPPAPELFPVLPENKNSAIT